MTYKRVSNGTDKAVKARKQWDADHIERISIAVSKEKKEIIKANAKRLGLSVSGFINRAIDETMQRDQDE